MASSLEILNLAASEGDKILLVATPNVDQNQLLTLKNTLANQVSTSGVVAFEQLERVAVAPLPTGDYTAIYSNLIQPSVETHSTTTLQKFLGTLAPGGSLTLRELVLTSPLPPAACPVSRTSQELASSLKLAGFIDVTVRFVDTIPDTDLVDFFHAWGATRIEQGIQTLGGKLAVATIVARKPAYEVGQKMALNFTKKTSTQPNKTTTQPAKSKVVWTILDDDIEDEELEDEDDLLDETDKVKPSKESLARPDDCELVDGKRKACKNCTCGRGSMLGDDDIDLTDGSSATSAEPEIVEVDPTPKKVGGCGSCALGDAFRCSTCPYLGMPTFGEGEKVVLAGVFGGDDIDI